MIIISDKDVMTALQEQGRSTNSMQRFFEVGEWLLCFEGACMLVRDDPSRPLWQLPAFLQLETYFSEDLA